MRRYSGAALVAFAIIAGVLFYGLYRRSGVRDPVPAGISSTSPGPAPTDCHYRGIEAASSALFTLPDRRCSPGATNSAVTPGNVQETICRSGYSRSIRPPESVTEPEKLRVMRAYGVSGTRSFELDHVVAISIGGAPNSYKNYYPEPDYQHPHGFYLNPKDRLESALRRLVCGGKMGLRKAQHLIMTNWVAAYQRYVRYAR